MTFSKIVVKYILKLTAKFPYRLIYIYTTSLSTSSHVGLPLAIAFLILV